MSRVLRDGARGYDRSIQGPLSETDPMGRHISAGAVKKSHELGKPVSPFSHQVFLWHPDIGKEDVGRVGCAETHLSV